MVTDGSKLAIRHTIFLDDLDIRDELFDAMSRPSEQQLGFFFLIVDVVFVGLLRMTSVYS